MRFRPTRAPEWVKVVVVPPKDYVDMGPVKGLGIPNPSNPQEGKTDQREEQAGGQKEK